MTVISLDNIVTNILLKRKYSLHWYLEFLIYCKDGLREIAFDLPILALRYKVLTINENSAIEIPNDYQDWTNVSYRAGQYLFPLVEDNSLDLVPNYDSNFNIQPYANGIASQGAGSSQGYFLGYYPPYWWGINWNAYGENLGRQFGGSGFYAGTFKVNKPRNEIKINEDFPGTEIVLEYISNGMDADSATHIDSYAQFAIESFAMWQFKEHNRTYSEGEAQVAKADYEQQRKILTARLSDITVDRLKRIVQRNAIAIKY